MKNVPNMAHSKRLQELSRQHNLSDPFRYFFPDRHEFTYTPRNTLLNNRSRIDFFVISETLLDSLSDCKIANALQNKLFDHKAVTISFNEKKRMDGFTKKIYIDNKILDDDLLPFLIHASICETYLLNLNPDINRRININELLLKCGRIRETIRICGPPPHLISGEAVTEEGIADRERRKTRLEILKNALNLDILEREQLNCSADIFLEALLNNVKNDTISHQAFIKKIKKKKVTDLKSKIENLKNNWGRN
jgi:hypothetical protein